MTYTVGSLFSGIGGLDLGFERAGGFRVAWFCEADPFCRAVLAKHWPGVPCYEDVRELHGLADAADLRCVEQSSGPTEEGSADPRASDAGIVSRRPEGCCPAPVDVLIGGFPCQDVSHAGKRAGLDGARSGLWWEYWRLIGELRPRVAVMENVAGLFTSGIDAVLGSLAQIGFHSEWATLRASDVGAPHRRERVFIIAYPSVDNSLRAGQGNAGEGDAGRGQQGGGSGDSGTAAGAGGTRWPARPGEAQYEWEPPRVIASTGRRKLADAIMPVAAPKRPRRDAWIAPETQTDGIASDADARRAEPALGGVLDGLPPGLPRWRRAALQALGNAVVPQVAEIVARRVLDILQEQDA